MFPYVFLLIIPFIVQYFPTYDNSKLSVPYKEAKNKKAMKCFWSILFLLLVLRSESVGIDLKNYKRIFNYISINDWPVGINRSVEIGYNFLNKIVSLYINDFRALLVINSILSIIFIAKSYIKYSDDAMLTIVLFISVPNFVLLFSGLRQAIAISIAFIAFEFVRNKNKLLFIITVFIAMLFHTSAFIIIFMYPLYHIRIKRKHLLFIIPSMLFVLIFNEQIFDFFNIILSRFTKYDASISYTGAYSMLILFTMLAIFSFIIPDEDKMDNETLGMRNFLLLAVVLQMFAPLNTIAMRMNYYYIVFIPLVIPRVIKYRTQKFAQLAIIAKYIMFVFFLIYFFINAPRDNTLSTFPYQFFWE